MCIGCFFQGFPKHALERFVVVALESLANFDDRKSRIVELRFFGGLSAEETAEVLGISLRTVHRDWDFARAWLLRELRGHT